MIWIECIQVAHTKTPSRCGGEGFFFVILGFSFFFKKIIIIESSSNFDHHHHLRFVYKNPDSARSLAIFSSSLSLGSSSRLRSYNCFSSFGFSRLSSKNLTITGTGVR